MTVSYSHPSSLWHIPTRWEYDWWEYAGRPWWWWRWWWRWWWWPLAIMILDECWYAWCWWKLRWYRRFDDLMIWCFDDLMLCSWKSWSPAMPSRIQDQVRWSCLPPDDYWWSIITIIDFFLNFRWRFKILIFYLFSSISRLPSKANTGFQLLHPEMRRDYDNDSPLQ